MADYTKVIKPKLRAIPANWRIFGRDIVIPDYGTRGGKKVLNGYKILGSLRGMRTRI